MVRISENIRYLGVTLDSRLRFDSHLEKLVLRVEGVASLLGRIFSNVRRMQRHGNYTSGPCVCMEFLYGDRLWRKKVLGGVAQCGFIIINEVIMTLEFT